MVEPSDHENIGKIGELISEFKLGYKTAKEPKNEMDSTTENHNSFVHLKSDRKLRSRESIQLTSRNPVIPHGKYESNLEKAQNIARKTSLKIIEQPAPRKLRFRYDCEGRSAGAMQGVSSTSEYRTVPKVEITGYQGDVVIIVSCVEDTAPYRAHPNKLVGKFCQNGACKVEVNENADMTTSFPSLGVRCVKKDGIVDSLKQRESMKIDPFKKGFDYKPTSYNLNAIRLCFQAFIVVPGSQPIPVDPVISDVIFDRKSHGDLNIVDYSPNCSFAGGGTKILILSEKVASKDIEVHFEYTDNKGESHILLGDISKTGVHKQCGISLTTPPLLKKCVTEKFKARMYLYKPSDKSQSDPVDFYFYPDLDQEILKLPPFASFREDIRSPRKIKKSKSTEKKNSEEIGTEFHSFTEKIINMSQEELERSYLHL